MKKAIEFALAGIFCSGAALSNAADAERGKALFTQQAAPPCAVCHTYSKAGSNGMVGPNLDDLKPTAEQVRLAVTNGVGVMPQYGQMLSPEDIESLVLFVSEQ